MTARGVLNNNPLNIRPGAPWEGLGTPAAVDNFCNFSSAVWGFRAVFKNYIAKADRGVNTIRALITEWSPPADNTSAGDPTGEKSTAAYIAAVAKRTGFGPDEVINLKDWDVASKVCYAQTMQECGEFEPGFKQADMANGAYRAGIVNAPEPTLAAVGKTIGKTVVQHSATATTAIGMAQTAVATAQSQPHGQWIGAALVIGGLVLAAGAQLLKDKAK